MQFAKQVMTNRALQLLYDTMKTTGEVFREIGVTCLHKPAIIFLRQEFSSLALAGKLDLSLEEEIFKGIKSSKMAHFGFKCNKEDYLSQGHST
jgi:hypothetical protein